jgi:hypothetical protein
MKRINQMNFYLLGHLNRLRDVREGEVYANHSQIIAATEALLQRFLVTNKDTLPQTLSKAQQLREFIHKELVADTNRQLSDDIISRIDLYLIQFETTLADELERLPTYLVELVAAYSFGQLISKADTVFSEGIRKLIPEQALKDVRSAGACLDFDQATACGFHAFRAADAMIRFYYAHFLGVTPTKEPRDWGGYIRELRKAITNASTTKIPNVRTVELLDSIRAMDRNPVIHPEQDLDAETALSTFDLCKNAMTLMAIDIRNHP